MTNAIPVRLINLARNADRLEHMRRQFARSGIPFERLDAVDGRLLSEEEQSVFRQIRPRREGWLPGQIGCLLSHFAAWAMIAEGEAPHGLILEDDMHLSPRLDTLLASDAWIPADADIVRLETTGQWLRLSSPMPSAGGRKLARLTNPVWGAGAYILSKAAAQALIATDPAGHLPADFMLFYPEKSAIAGQLRTFQVTPAPAIQDKFLLGGRASLGSDIETAINKRSILRDLRREMSSRLLGKSKVRFS